MSEAERCPCGSGDVFGECCARIVRGTALAPTAEQLMRSRYTAFALGDVGHLMRTWHASTRPREIDLDSSIRWWRLEIVETTGGGPFDRRGTVHFIAHYRTADARARQEERSSFVRDGRAWYYLDGAAVGA
ncbi:YchJ family protein [Paramicrobacterium agarici]